jgi:hypothetical protein
VIAAVSVMRVPGAGPVGRAARLLPCQVWPCCVRAAKLIRIVMQALGAPGQWRSRRRLEVPEGIGWRFGVQADAHEVCTGRWWRSSMGVAVGARFGPAADAFTSGGEITGPRLGLANAMDHMPICRALRGR